MFRARSPGGASCPGGSVRVGLDRCLAPAIDLARDGVPAGSDCARVWRTSPRAPAALGPPPAFGARYRLPELGATLAGVASEGPSFVYTGPPADAIAGATWLTREDLAQYSPRWVAPVVGSYRGVEVSELPPPTQGVAALEALAILGDEEAGLSELVRAVALALEDALGTVRDGADVSHLMSADHVAARRAELPGRVAEPAGGTVCVCAVDRGGMAVSLLQSLYDAFGSGVVAGSTGIVLNNRAAGFAVQGAVAGGTRPYHTLIPGMLTRGSELVGPFGLMGGFIQAQSHVQFLTALLPDGDPQVALDRGRFRIDGSIIQLEQPLLGPGGRARAARLPGRARDRAQCVRRRSGDHPARRDAVRRLGRPQGRLRARDLTGAASRWFVASRPLRGWATPSGRGTGPMDVERSETPHPTPASTDGWSLERSEIPRPAR